MAKNDQVNKEIKKAEKPLQRLNGIFNDIMSTIDGSKSQRERQFTQLSAEVDDILHNDLSRMKQHMGDDMSMFIVKTLNSRDKNSSNSEPGKLKSMDELFSDETGDSMMSFFQDRYRNQNILYADLATLCSQLPELIEAINTSRDAIVTADDIGSAVSYAIDFKNFSGEDKDKESYIDAAINMQKRFGLLQKLKAHMVPNTLQYGRYYVYTVPYSKLFSDHMEKVNNGNVKFGEATMESVTESFVSSFIKDNDISPSAATTKEAKSSFEDILGHVHVNNSDLSLPIMEGIDISSLVPGGEFDQKVQKEAKKAATAKLGFADGTKDLTDKEKDFSNIKDCYIKMIDPRKIIPVKILDKTIGYYYIHQSAVTTTRSPFTQSVKTINTISATKQKDIETEFLSKITDKIVKSFDKKFLQDNEPFKDLILNAIMYNDIYKKDIKFQYIPAEYMTEYHINKDENGEGTSMIMPSIFYAKLYLALLLFNMITILTKSTDTRVSYVKQGLDQNVSNKIQDIARSMKESQINFMELMNYSALTSKIGKGKEVFMPVGISGDRGIEFDILAGQNVDLHSDLMEMLKTSYISATGVPSVIMNYINEADYAKTLVMANAKFLGRVVGWQLDFNEANTELYKKILKFTTEIPENIIDMLTFTLLAPKALNNINMSDLISNADVEINALIKALVGEVAEPTPMDNIVKDILYKDYSKMILHMLPWKQAEEILEKARVQAGNVLARRESEKKEDQ